ncbi:Uncharacterised protein [Mycobacteroides abscessus subsp. abscessus]|nr:Uncharacterised protein [Mycobacteroides abscessus subsp. abscessus]
MGRSRRLRYRRHDRGHQCPSAPARHLSLMVRVRPGGQDRAARDRRSGEHRLRAPGSRVARARRDSCSPAPYLGHSAVVGLLHLWCHPARRPFHRLHQRRPPTHRRHVDRHSVHRDPVDVCQPGARFGAAAAAAGRISRLLGARTRAQPGDDPRLFRGADLAPVRAGQRWHLAGLRPASRRPHGTERRRHGGHSAVGRPRHRGIRKGL